MAPQVTPSPQDVNAGAPAWTRRFAQLADDLTDLWSYPVLRHARVRIWLAILIIGYCLARAFIGLAGSDMFSHDAFFVLDGAWRMLHHQRPHSDFGSMVGFFSYTPSLIGLWISAGRVQGLAYGQAIAGLLLSTWAYLLGRRRLLDVPLLLLCLTVTVTAVAPFALGSTPLQVGPATTYNRYGYALLSLLLIEALVDRREAYQIRDFAGACSTGAIIGILLFLKITFFFIAVFLLIALIPCRTQTKSRWAGLTAGFAGLFILSCSYYRFNVVPIFQDLRLLAHAKHISYRFYLFDSTLQDAAFLFAFSIIAGCLLLAHHQTDSAWKVPVAGAAVAAGGTMAILGCYEQYGFPLAAFLAIIILDTIAKRLFASSKPGDLFRASVLLLGSVLIAAPLFFGSVGMLAGLYGKLWTARHFTAMNSAKLYGFIPIVEDDWYTGMVNDGIKLLAKYRHKDETVMSLDFTNPFSVGLSIPPAAGGATGLQYGSSFNDQYHQSAEQLFGYADLVIVPIGFTDASLQTSVPRIYGPYLASHFGLIGQSLAWRLYRRNDRAAPR